MLATGGPWALRALGLDWGFTRSLGVDPGVCSGVSPRVSRGVWGSLQGGVSDVFFWHPKTYARPDQLQRP